ncbi:hypothetical protein BH09PLA1_BH09PLA1_15910 [soil metagenome]
MTCNERRDSILQHVLNDSDVDALSPAERESLRAHLASGCPTCSAALAEAEATLAQIPLSLTLQSPPAYLRDRLMQRVLANPRTATTAVAPRSDNVLRTLLALAACLAIGFAATFYFITPRYQRQLAARDARIQQLLTQNASTEDMAQILNAENLQMVSLNHADPQPDAKGRLIWDRDRGMWHVSVFDMKPPEPGQTFELWYITPDQRKIAAGTFDVDAKGNGSIMVKLPKDIGPVAIAAITNEPMGGVEQPTGKVHILVDFSKTN